MKLPTEVGTVVRWTANGKFTYSAIYIGEEFGWYTSATDRNMNVKQVYRTNGLIRLLKRDEVKDIEVATDWEGIIK